MKVLVTGADSFLGKNICAELKNREYEVIKSCGECVDKDVLNSCDAVFHLLTVYRSDDVKEFERVNVNFTKSICEKYKGRITYASSTRAGDNTPYGKSKKEAENTLKEWENENKNNKSYIIPLANEFGKWCEPFTNSVVATFCYKVAREEEITVNDENALLNLMYIDDIVNAFIATLDDNVIDIPTYQMTVGKLADTIKSFHTARKNLDVPSIENDIIKKLYGTYLSYLPPDKCFAETVKHTDNRGSFTELIHFGGKGQVSVNVSKPGIVKGNHWHNTKTERFIVISGEGVIRLRKIGTKEVIEYPVNGEVIKVIDIPPGYTHNIENTGKTDMSTIMWVNEVFDPNVPDTYFEEV